MSGFYLDASVILPMLIDEPATLKVEAFMRAATDEFAISNFAAAEVASAISRLVRTGQLQSAADGLAILADFDVWAAAATSVVPVSTADMHIANLFVRRFDLMLRAPDALHAAVCRRTDLQLVTLDRRLATAAQELGIGVHSLASTP